MANRPIVLKKRKMLSQMTTSSPFSIEKKTEMYQNLQPEHVFSVIISIILHVADYVRYEGVI